MRRSILLAALLALPSAPAIADQARQGASVPRVQGLTYHAARARLIRAGWRPVEGVIDPTNPDLASGNGPAFIRRGYRELVSCSGTGLAHCRFAWRRPGWLLHVVTAGEEPGARVQRAWTERGNRD